MTTLTPPTTSVKTPLLKGTLTPQQIMPQHLRQLWSEFTQEEKTLVQKPVALMLQMPLEEKAHVHVAGIEWFKIACGSTGYKSDAVAKAVIRNGLGVVTFHGEIITRENLHKTETANPQQGVGTGQGRSIASGGIRQPTAHLWKVRFTLPEKPSDIASLSDYQTLAQSIASDYDQISKGIEEAKQLAALALAQCEEGKKLLEKIGGKWAEVATLTDKKTALEKAIAGLEALNGEGEFTKAIQKRQKELASLVTEIDKATLAARESSAPAPVVAKP